jgi:hypothetical protein
MAGRYLPGLEKNRMVTCNVCPLFRRHRLAINDERLADVPDPAICASFTI